ncbi:MAG: CapA family protein [Caulobacteraceae bacterium]
MYGVGDVAPDRPDPRDCFALVRDEIRKADVAFCQLEVSITDRGERLPQCRHTHRAVAGTGAAIKDAGFTVVSCAGNHCMDWGKVGLADTMANLTSAGLEVVGAGVDIAAARKPVITEIKGKRIAFLAYNSILPMGYWADEGRPGCAPMRAWTHYEQIEHDQPGTPARIHTFPNAEDLAALLADVKAAKAQADYVILSLHWGIHFIPAVLAQYQRDVAHAAIDAGVDLILGHHAHILKGVEVYKGVPIFYSLCQFAMDLRISEAHSKTKGFREIQALHPHWQPEFDTMFGFPDDCRLTGVVKYVIGADGPRTTFLPAYINRDAQPEILKASDPRFDQVVTYLRQISAAADLSTTYTVDGDEVRMS